MKIQIRPERPEDAALIANVNFHAFGGEGEVRLIERIRKSPEFIPELSLVALEGERCIGHLMMSVAYIQTKESKVPVLALAPMAVLPDFQSQTVGTQLLQAALKKATALGYRVVVVVGHPEYYPRFGFVPASERGLQLPFEVPEEAFMVRELLPDALNGLDGKVLYPAAFNELLL